MDKGVLAKAPCSVEWVGAPLFPSFLFWLALGRRWRQAWPGVFPGQCYQVTSQGAGAGEAGVTAWNTGLNTRGTARLCSTEIAAVLEFSALPQNRTSASKKQQQHRWADVGGLESVFSISDWLGMGTLWSRTDLCSQKTNILKFS